MPPVELAAAPSARPAGWRWLVLGGWLALVFGVAAVGSQFPPGAWYATLAKPSWNPPSWVFGPAWTLLYTLMAVAAWLVWQRGGWARQAAPLRLFLLQLALNGAWSWLFFGRQRPDLAFYEIVTLWVAILATLYRFWRVRPVAGALLIPYLAWVSFAAVLNFTLWQLNAS